jgi:hypothetical protein
MMHRTIKKTQTINEIFIKSSIKIYSNFQLRLFVFISAGLYEFQYGFKLAYSSSKL